MKRVARGDLRACRMLAHRLSGRIEHLVECLAGERNDSFAITVEALLETLRAAAIYRRNAGIEHWADRIAVRVVLERAEQRHDRKRVARRTLHALRNDSSSGPANGASELAAEVLATLLPLERRLLILRQLCGLEPKLIATLLHLDERGVQRHLGHALNTLRARVASHAHFVMHKAADEAARRRFAHCLERRVLGDALDLEDAEFFERFAATDPLAARERSVLQELSRPAAKPGANGRAIVEAVMNRLTERTDSGDRSSSAPAAQSPMRARLSWLLFASSIAAIALTIVLVPNSANFVPADPLPPQPQAARLRLVHASGEVRIDGELATPASMLLQQGATLSVGAGSACLALDSGGSICASSGTLLHLTRTQTPARQLELETGQIVVKLPLQPEGVNLTITSANVSTTSTGATFMIESDQSSGVALAVFDGKLLMKHGAAEPVQLSARDNANVQDEKVLLGHTSSEQDATAQQLLGPVQLFHKPLAASLDLRELPADAEVLLDDRAFGTTPLLALIPAGPHTLVVRNPERSLAALRFTSEVGRSTALSFELPQAATVPTAP